MLTHATLQAEIAAADAARDHALATANYQAGRADALRLFLAALPAVPPATDPAPADRPTPHPAYDGDPPHAPRV